MAAIKRIAPDTGIPGNATSADPSSADDQTLTVPSTPAVKPLPVAPVVPDTGLTTPTQAPNTSTSSAPETQPLPVASTPSPSAPATAPVSTPDPLAFAPPPTAAPSTTIPSTPTTFIPDAPSAPVTSAPSVPSSPPIISEPATFAPAAPSPVTPSTAAPAQPVINGYDDGFTASYGGSNGTPDLTPYYGQHLTFADLVNSGVLTKDQALAIFGGPSSYRADYDPFAPGGVFTTNVDSWTPNNEAAFQQNIADQTAAQSAAAASAAPVPGRYLEGGQTFTDFDQANAAKQAVDQQIAGGGSAILPTQQPGGTFTDDTLAYLTGQPNNTPASQPITTPATFPAPSDPTSEGWSSTQPASPTTPSSTPSTGDSGLPTVSPLPWETTPTTPVTVPDPSTPTSTSPSTTSTTSTPTATTVTPPINVPDPTLVPATAPTSTSTATTPTVSTTPTNPNDSLIGKTISGPSIDRYTEALKQYNDWVAQTDPQFQATERDRLRYAAANGTIGQGATASSINDIALQRENDIRSQRDKFLGDALNASYDDIYKNIGIDQQQQGFQAGQAQQGFANNVTLQQLQDSEAGQQWQQLLAAAGFNAQQIQQAFENAYKVQQLSDDETGQAFYRAMQQYLIGSSGDPTNIDEWLAGLYALPQNIGG